MKCVIIEHTRASAAGAVVQWAESRKIRLEPASFKAGSGLPSAQADLYILTGGPMSANDNDEWLLAEKAAVRGWIAAGKKVAGICLGAQIIASALGAKVCSMNDAEIGLHEVRLTESGLQSAVMAGVPASFKVFQWHGETFDMPAGCVPLAGSTACPNQAFLFGTNSLGLQFHPEATPEIVEKYALSRSAMPGGGPFMQSAEEIRKGMAECGEINKILFAILDNFLALKAV